MQFSYCGIIWSPNPRPKVTSNFLPLNCDFLTEFFFARENTIWGWASFIHNQSFPPPWRRMGFGLPTLAFYSTFYSLMWTSLPHFCYLVLHHVIGLPPPLVVFMEEVSAGEQRRGTGLPTKQSSLFCLVFGCCTYRVLHASYYKWTFMMINALL